MNPLALLVALSLPLPDPAVILCQVDPDGQVVSCADTLFALDTVRVWGDGNPHLDVGSGPGRMVAGYHGAAGFEALIAVEYTARGPGSLPFVFVIEHPEVIMADGAEAPSQTWTAWPEE